MKTTDFETLPELAKLLATQGWVIHEYKVDGKNTATLSIFHKERDEEGENG